MNDMSSVIAPKSDQLNTDDLISGPRTIRIREVDIRPGTEQPVSVFYDGDNGKPWKPCKSTSRLLVAGWGPDAKRYVGRSLTLFRDPKVTWGGMAVGGVRISHMQDMDPDKLNSDGEMQIALAATKKARAIHVVKPLVVQQQVEKVADGVRALVARLAEVGSDYNAILAEPAVIKQRAWLVKNRPELAAEVDAAIPNDDPFEGPADEQRGDAHDGNQDHPARAVADRLIGQFRTAKTADVLDKLTADSQETRDAMPEAMAMEVEVAISDARNGFA